MNHAADPFLPLATGILTDEFAALTQRPANSAHRVGDALLEQPALAPAVACLHGFDLLEQAQVTGVPHCPGEVMSARSTVPLRRSMIGREVLVMFETGDARKPIILGVIEPHPLRTDTEVQSVAAATTTAVQVDGERQVIQAEREVVLRCGDASITLTRAGKVLIKGHYILSRSTGYNKIKGAAVDIN